MPFTAEAGDSLSTFRSEVRTADAEPEPEHEKPHGGKRGRHRHCDDDDGGVSLWFTGYVVTSPWWVPAAMLGDDYVEPSYFARHPYAPTEAGPNYYGYMMKGLNQPTPGYDWAGRVSGDFGTDFDSMATVTGKILLENTSRFGLDSQFDFRHQDLGGGMSDELWTGDFNIVYRFAQNDMVQMRSGVGFNFLSDTLGSDMGINFTYGGDIMLGDPWVLSTELDLGTLGEASVTHFRTTIGAVWHGVEVYTGYDYYEVGDADTSSMISGVRIWF